MLTSNSPDRPSANSYWVVPDRFAAGEYPGAWYPAEAATRLKTLLDAGIDHFIDLTEPESYSPTSKLRRSELSDSATLIQWERHPIIDASVPRSPEQMAAILAIDDAIGNNKTVYDCWGGVGRTGTVVGCWLVRHGHTGDSALRQIAEWWQGVEKIRWHPRSPETREQACPQLARDRARRGERVSEITTQDRFRGCLLRTGGRRYHAGVQSARHLRSNRRHGRWWAIGLNPGEWTDKVRFAMSKRAVVFLTAASGPRI